MNFPRLENKHYIMIVIGLVALYLLQTCDKDDENFTVVPMFPHIPPKNWSIYRSNMSFIRVVVLCIQWQHSFIS